MSSPATQAQGSRIFVTTEVDVSVDGQCSLVEAIENANAATKEQHVDCMTGVPGGPDVIVLADHAAYDLSAMHNEQGGSNGLPAITSDVTVEGRGATIQRAAGAPAMRLFYVAPGGKLALYDVTLDPAAAEGQEARLDDAVISEGELHLFNSGLPGQLVTAADPSAPTALLSAAAMAPAGTGIDFRILSPLGQSAQVIEHVGVTGDDRGAIAASSSHVFYTGDSGTGRFDLDDLSGGTNLGPVFDSLTSDLQTGVVYSLGTDAATPHMGGWGLITHLLEHDGATLALTGNTIPLSTPIYVDWGTGLFAGYGRIVLHSASDYHVYNIDLPSGEVTDLGYVGYLGHQGCEYWAYWGVAEYFDDSVFLVYIQDWQTIVRTRVGDGETTPLERFSSLGDMCGFTVSPLTNRWYFHFDWGSQFGSYDEALGYANAILFMGDRPLVFAFPTPLQAKQPPGSMIYDPIQNVPVGPDNGTVMTIDVDPGQTLTVLAEPDPDLELTLALLDPASQPLAQAGGGSPGAPVWLNTVPAVQAGTYSVVLNGVMGTSGLADITVALNVAMEEEQFGGSVNDTGATAQDMGPSFIALTDGATRGAVTGEGDAGVLEQQTESGSLFYPNEVTVEFQGLPPAEGPGQATITFRADLGDRLDEYLSFDVEGLLMQDLFGTVGDCDVSTAVVELSQGELATLLADGSIAFHFVPSSAVDEFCDEFVTVELSYLSDTSTADYYAFDLAAGQQASLVLSAQGAGAGSLALENSTGAVVGTGTPGSGSILHTVTGFVAPETGRYLASVTGLGTYNLLVLRDALFDLEPNGDPATAQDLSAIAVALGYAGPEAASGAAAEAEPNDSLTAPQNVDYELWNLNYDEDIGDPESNTSRLIPHLTVSGSGDGTLDYYAFRVPAAGLLGLFDIDYAAGFDSYLRLYDAAGNVLAANDDTHPGVDPGSRNRLDAFVEFAFPQAGVYVLEVGACCVRPVPAGAAYELHLSVKQHPLGLVRDFYRLDVAAGTSLNFATFTPSDGPGEFVNDGDPYLELFGPSGETVASDDNGGPDGRNARLLHEAAVPGTYAVAVSSAGSGGEYVLVLQQQLLSMEKDVSNPTPLDGEVISFTVVMTHLVGSPATDVTISDTLDSGLTFLGPVVLEPADASAVLATSAADLPLLAQNLTVEPGERATLTFSVRVDAGLTGGTQLTNTVAVTSAEHRIPLLDTATVTVARRPAVVVVKTPSTQSATVRDVITYSYEISNTGNVDLSNVVAEDDRLGAVTLDRTLLAPDEAASGSLVYTVVEEDLPGPLANTVTVTATPPVGEPVAAAATAAVALTSQPSLTVRKAASASSAVVGEVVTYTYVVSNTGDVGLSNVVALDDKLGPVTLGATSLAAGEGAVGILAYKVVMDDLPGPLVNTVTVSGTPAVGDVVVVQATASIKVKPGEPTALDTGEQPQRPGGALYLPLVSNGSSQTQVRKSAE